MKTKVEIVNSNGESEEDINAHFEESLRPIREQKAQEKAAREKAKAKADGCYEIQCTDVGNAERLIQRHGHELHYCYPWKSWLSWDGRRWAVDESGDITRRAINTARAIYDEARLCKNPDNREKLGKHALKSESVKSIQGMIELAKPLHHIPILPPQMDANPFLLNVRNGTLDLKTGLLHAHRPRT